MRDELQLLRQDSGLSQLLEHYCRNTTEDREAWLDRCMALEGLEPKRLHELHGLLIAFGWIEQNTGQSPVVKAGACPHCYRTTAAGRRALKQYRLADADADNLAPAA